MIKFGCKQSRGDDTLFLKHSDLNKLTVLIVYIDDIIITMDDHVEITHLGTLLTYGFEIQNLGKLIYFLGIEVGYYFSERMFLSQQKYVLDLLKEIKFSNCKPISTPNL